MNDTTASTPLPVLSFGLGPIGLAAAKLVLRRPTLRLVGAVDADPAKQGARLQVLLESESAPELEVTAEPGAAQGNPAVAIHATGSRLESVLPQLQSLLELGYDVVSSCEELSFPWRRHEPAARRLDEIAKTAGRTVVGTGVNPGFLMDALPLFLGGLCQSVERVDVERVLDATKRRGPFQRKIGSGLSPEEFRETARAGRLGHVGLEESLDMILDSLGWKPDRVESRIEPVVATHRIETPHVTVEAGEVRGLEQQARAFVGDRQLASLRFVAALDAGEDGDTVRVAGSPSLDVRLRGTHGDLATVAVLVNAAPHVAAARPGLLTMRDLPPLWGTRP